MMAWALRALTQPPPPSPEAAAIARLTGREREVITLLGAGLSNKAIATALGVTEAGVRYHLAAIYAKVGVTDRLALALYAYQHGLAQPPF
jgi:DNA-binding NarL/FixJ family response regulator